MPHPEAGTRLSKRSLSYARICVFHTPRKRGWSRAQAFQFVSNAHVLNQHALPLSLLLKKTPLKKTQLLAHRRVNRSFHVLYRLSSHFAARVESRLLLLDRLLLENTTSGMYFLQQLRCSANDILRFRKLRKRNAQVIQRHKVLRGIEQAMRITHQLLGLKFVQQKVVRNQSSDLLDIRNTAPLFKNAVLQQCRNLCAITRAPAFDHLDHRLERSI